MKIVLVSSFLNHHQKPLCEALLKRADEFYFVSTENTTNVGYQIASKEVYVLCYFEENQKELIREKILEADVVIFGACPTELIQLRMAKNKLSFIYAERFFKKGIWRRFIPSIRKAIHQKIISYKDKNLYVLCASAFLSYDLSLLGYPFEKCFRWGYFPAVKEQYNIQDLIDKKKKNSILWCSRLIPWKHPEDVICMAEKLKKEGYDFELNMIGDGVLKKKLRDCIHKKGLEDCVHLLGSMPTDEVRRYMEESQIFLFTSDRMEGWGAVLNESMNSGCAVVASHMIGSVPFLIENETNGIVYKSGNWSELSLKVADLLNETEKAKELGIQAYEMLISHWTAEEAVVRLLKLINVIEKGEETINIFADGPCSNAKIVKDNWY